jgi:hypothetical protein
MSRAAASAVRSRPVRAGVLVLLLLWVVQFGAQLCATHCGVASTGTHAVAVDREAGRVAAVDVAVGVAGAPRAEPPAADVASPPAAHAPGCPLAEVCDLGQSAMLPAAARLPVAVAAPAGPPAAPARAARFERSPEDRPPAA